MEKTTFEERSNVLIDALNDIIATEEITLAPKAVTKVTSFKRWLMAFTKSVQQGTNHVIKNEKL